MARQDSMARRCVVRAVAALALLGACARPIYPAPPPRPVADTTAPSPVAADGADVGRIHALEHACRARLSHTTADASLTALDRVHEVLGAGCDIETVDHDPLHWRLRCRSDALFDSGKYALSARPTTCHELGGNASPFSCAGAVLASLLRPEGPSASEGAMQRMELAVLGHVDRQPLRTDSDAHLCSALQSQLGYQPEVAWTPVAADADEAERLHANDQLSWCRAATVGEALISGMRRAVARHRRALPAHSLELAVAGLGDAWLASQPDERCPGRAAGDDDGRCAEARRVDLLIRFVPSEQTTEAPCRRQGDSARDALACLEQCMEQAAMGQQVGSGIQTRAAPIFIAGEGHGDALPAGFYLHRVTQQPGWALDLRRVCRTLGIADARCGG